MEATNQGGQESTSRVSISLTETTVAALAAAVAYSNMPAAAAGEDKKFASEQSSRQPVSAAV